MAHLGYNRQYGRYASIKSAGLLVLLAAIVVDTVRNLLDTIKVGEDCERYFLGVVLLTGVCLALQGICILLIIVLAVLSYGDEEGMHPDTPAIPPGEVDHSATKVKPVRLPIIARILNNTLIVLVLIMVVILTVKTILRAGPAPHLLCTCYRNKFS